MYRNVWSCNRMDEYDDGPYWTILLMYGSHDMRHTGFRRLTIVNGTPGFSGVTTSPKNKTKFYDIHKV